MPDEPTARWITPATGATPQRNKKKCVNKIKQTISSTLADNEKKYIEHMEQCSGPIEKLVNPESTSKANCGGCCPVCGADSRYYSFGCHHFYCRHKVSCLAKEGEQKYVRVVVDSTSGRKALCPV